MNMVFLVAYLQSIIMYELMHRIIWSKFSKKKHFKYYMITIVFAALLLVIIYFMLSELINQIADIKA